MAELNQNSPDILCAEILADARREREEILRCAEQEAATMLAAAQAEAEKIRDETQAQARSEAARRKEMTLATVAVETGKLRSARVEALLEAVHAEIRRRLLEQDPEARETVVALATEALCRMPGTQFVLKVSAADQAAFGLELPQEIARRTGRPELNLTVAADGAMTGSGVTIQDASGLLFWDNRLLSRLERLWPELRRQIAVQTSLTGENSTTGGTP